MHPGQFSAIIKKLNETRAVTVHLSLPISYLETILDTALSNNCIDLVTFTGVFSQNQIQILTNLYIACIYEHQTNNVQQLISLATRYHLQIHGTFNYRTNAKKHNVELHGITTANVLTPDTRNKVAELKRRSLDIFVQGAETNNVELMLQAYYLKDINPDLPIKGILPLEYAFAKNCISTARALLNTCGANLFARNTARKDAMAVIFLRGSADMLKFLIDGDYLVPCEFHNITTEYVYERDIYRRIIDANNSGLLINLLHKMFTVNGIFAPELAFIKALYLYAEEHGKHFITYVLTDLYSRAIAMDADFINAIIRNDLHTFQQCLEKKVDINCVSHDSEALLLICRLGRRDMLKLILQDPILRKSLVFFNFQDVVALKYRLEQDIIHLAITFDQIEIFLCYFEYIGGDIYNGKMGILANMLALARQARASNLLAYLTQVDSKYNTHRNNIFQLAVNQDYDALLHGVVGMDNLDFQIDGQSILHVLCEQNASAVVQTLLLQHISINEPNQAGEYPVTICAKNGYNELVQQFLNCMELRFYNFNNTQAEGYEYALDLIKIAIDRNDVDLLTLIIRSNHLTQRFDELNVTALQPMLDYATENQKTQVQALLSGFIEELLAGRPIFAEVIDTLHNFLDTEQNVARIDRSAVPSIIALAKHFNIQIVWNAEKNCFELKSDVHDFKEIFQRLVVMIAEVTEVTYPIYKVQKAVSSAHIKESDYKFDRMLSAEEYRGIASQIYNLINEGLAGHIGSYATWHSSWVLPGDEKMVPGQGLTTIEIWALVILAAENPNPFPDVWLDDEELAKNRRILVDTLVKCARAYNTNNKFAFDIGGPSKNSCIHGTAMRPLSEFNHKHAGIEILTSPMPWALEVVEAATLEFFAEYPERESINSSLLVNSTQLAAEKKAELDTFYAAANEFVRVRLINELGMMAQGGHLLINELNDALVGIENVALINTDTLEDDQSAYNTPELHFVPNKTIISVNSHRLLQFKLPPTTDVVFNALLLSAFDQNVVISAFMNDAKKIRKKMHDIIYSAIFEPQQLVHLGCPASFKHLIQSKMGSKINEEDMEDEENLAEKIRAQRKREQLPSYIDAILNDAKPNATILELLSYLLQIGISVYSFGGRHIFNITCIPLGCRLPANHKYINICVPQIKNGTKYEQDFSNATVLISEGNCAKMAEFLQRLNIRTLRQQLESVDRLSKNYQPIPGQDISCEGQIMHQIKMPLNGDSAFAAIMFAARKIGNAEASSIPTIHDLRIRVHAQLLEDSNSQLDSEYLQLISMPEYPVGLAEIAIMARILHLNIYVKRAGKPGCTKLDAESSESIYLMEVDGHFNCLIPPEIWQPTFGHEHKRTRFDYAPNGGGSSSTRMPAI